MRQWIATNRPACSSARSRLALAPADSTEGTARSGVRSRTNRRPAASASASSAARSSSRSSSSVRRETSTSTPPAFIRRRSPSSQSPGRGRGVIASRPGVGAEITNTSAPRRDGAANEPDVRRTPRLHGHLYTQAGKLGHAPHATPYVVRPPPSSSSFFGAGSSRDPVTARFTIVDHTFLRPPAGCTHSACSGRTRISTRLSCSGPSGNHACQVGDYGSRIIAPSLTECRVAQPSNDATGLRPVYGVARVRDVETLDDPRVAEEGGRTGEVVEEPNARAEKHRQSKPSAGAFPLGSRGHATHAKRAGQVYIPGLPTWNRRYIYLRTRTSPPSGYIYPLGDEDSPAWSQQGETSDRRPRSARPSARLTDWAAPKRALEALA